jgi:soluble lytic murein transglycosylase
LRIILPLLIVLLLPIYSFSEDITLNWLSSKPRSIAKDFYIWRYLSQDITPKQAIDALGQAKNVNNKLLFRYAKKLKHKDTTKVVKCIKSSHTNLLNKAPDCIEIGMSTFKATKLSKSQLKKLSYSVKDKYPKSSQRFNILASSFPFRELLNTTNEIFFDTFNQCGGKYRVNNFNYHLPKDKIQQLRKEKNFNQTIKLIVTNKKLNKLQESLLNISSKGLNHKSTFLLAINAIQHHKYNIALKFLDDAYKNAYFQQDKDKVLFWKYKVTNNKKTLEKLSNSWDNNIYSMLAMEKIGKKPQGIVYDLNKTTSISNNIFDTSLPFPWFPVLKDTKKMNSNKMEKYIRLFNTEDTQPHLAFVKERFHRYRKSYFITPYKETISKYKKQRQSLIYAIARQESRFIPTSISSAYAMGIMQIMPFLSKAIAKELKEPYDIDKQLQPTTNIRYAHHHLNFLEKRLKHPLFIAYGYNGGIGFTKRLFKNGLFKKGKFEPYLSMELLPYDETRKYGKKVLANYYIYNNHINKKNKIKLSTLIQKAVVPYQN